MPDDLYATVFENNRRWVEEKRASDPDFFTRLARGLPSGGSIKAWVHMDDIRSQSHMYGGGYPQAGAGGQQAFIFVGEISGEDG